MRLLDDVVSHPSASTGGDLRESFLPLVLVVEGGIYLRNERAGVEWPPVGTIEPVDDNVARERLANYVECEDHADRARLEQDVRAHPKFVVGLEPRRDTASAKGELFFELLPRRMHIRTCARPRSDDVLREPIPSIAQHQERQVLDVINLDLRGEVRVR